MLQHAFIMPRLTLDILQSSSGPAEFASDVFKGLSSNPKKLNPAYFYDEAGSLLFERICRLPEYYITRTERQILHECAGAIAGLLPVPVNLIEFGSGSSDKTRLLIESLLRCQKSLNYVPIDISASAVVGSSRRLVAEYPNLSIAAMVAEYGAGILHMRDSDSTPKLIVFLGSNLGNFDPAQALDFLVSIRGVMSKRDRLLVGNDLAQDPEILFPAYNDSQGVTAAFNLNLLQRINRELGGTFDLSSFSHIAPYNESLHRVEMHLLSNRTQRVRIENFDAWFEFKCGETIHTENSYKYPVEELDKLFRSSGLELVKRWTDDRVRFSLSLLAPQTGARD